MSARRKTVQADLEQVSGSVLTPVRWVVLLGILASLWLPHSNRLTIHQHGMLAAIAAYAAAAAFLPRLHRRPFSSYGIGRLLLLADLLFSATVFLLSDGVRSPYFGLWYIALIHAALLLGSGPALGVAGGAAALIIGGDLLFLSQAGMHRFDLDFGMGKLPFLFLITWAAGQLGQALRDREAARREIERRALTLETEEARVRQDMEIARRVQESLLPVHPTAPSGLKVATFAAPAREVGGDTFDLVTLPDGRLLVALADVSGKGVPAALLTVAVQQGIRQYASPDPTAVLAGVNRFLAERTPDEMFVTAVCVVIDPREGSVIAASAGHPPVLWWNQRRGQMAAIAAPSLALGLLPEWSGRSERWQMGPGDVLLLYTDGVTDVKIDERERLGEERLQAALGETPPKSAHDWIERLRSRLAECAEWPDDVTAIALDWTPPAEFPASNGSLSASPLALRSPRQTIRS